MSEESFSVVPFIYWGYTVVAADVAENAVLDVNAVNDAEGAAGDNTKATAGPVAAFDD